MEELLRRSESNLKAIIENTDASIYSLDRDFRYITFNKLLQNTLKVIYGLEVKPGDNVYDFLEKLDPKEASDWQKVYSEALKGETVKFEKEFSINDFHSYISFAIYPIWENGIVIGLSCFAIDITKRKQAEETQRQTELRYRQIVETAQEGIWLIDENNETTFVNKKMCEMMGYTEEEMIGKQNYFFRDEDMKKIAVQQIDIRKQGKHEIHDSKFVTKNGKHIWTKLSTNPVYGDDGVYKGTLAMISDITEKRI